MRLPSVLVSKLQVFIKPLFIRAFILNVIILLNIIARCNCAFYSGKGGEGVNGSLFSIMACLVFFQ